MTLLTDFVSQGRPVEGHRPWPRVVVSPDTWRSLATSLADGQLALLGLWAEPQTVHAAVLEEEGGEIAVLGLDCPDGRFPSIGAVHPPAIRLERAIRDLYGLEADGLHDRRAWLDHGRWQVRHPLGATGPAHAQAPYPFLDAIGESLHQVAVGPVHAGIIEPGHFRFTVNGETIVRVEERLGYVHKGIEGLMAGAGIAGAARLAGRVSGDSTVAYALAFARAVEAACGVEAPPRACRLRAVMAELERLANHLGDIGAICNDASFALMHAHCSVLREGVLRTAGTVFGHRLMMDRIVPGGVAVDASDVSCELVLSFLARLRKRFPHLVDLYENTASLQDRTAGAGVLQPRLARQFAAGGFVGRASGRSFDARRLPGYAPYDELRPEVPVLRAGDVNARVWIRIREVEQSINMIEKLCAALPEGPIATEVRSRAGEGAALVEGFRGDVFVWLRIGADGRIGRCHLRDPSWFQWPLLEAAIEGDIIADFPLCNKSFNCSYSGHDL